MMDEMIYKYEKKTKHTGVGAVEKHIAYCPVCRAFVEPVEWRISKGGTHGTVWFEHEHPLSFISFYRSSLGHASVEFEGKIPEEIKKVAMYLWVWERVYYEDVLETIKDPQKLNEVLEEIRELEKPAPPLPPLDVNVKLLVQTRRRLSSEIFVKVWDENMQSIFEMPDCTDAKLLVAIRDAVARLEDRFKVPIRFSSGDYCLPRYYLIETHFDREKACIVDIFNIRRDGRRPGRWSYRKGYWVPLVVERILDAIEIAIRRIERAKGYESDQ
jgi:hypothetical protein